jgi:hypothetical protein
MKKIFLTVLVSFFIGISSGNCQSMIDSKILKESKSLKFKFLESSNKGSWVYQITSPSNLQGTIEMYNDQNQLISKELFDLRHEEFVDKISVSGLKNFIIISIKIKDNEIYSEKFFIQ